MSIIDHTPKELRPMLYWSDASPPSLMTLQQLTANLECSRPENEWEGDWTMQIDAVRQSVLQYGAYTGTFADECIACVILPEDLANLLLFAQRMRPLAKSLVEAVSNPTPQHFQDAISDVFALEPYMKAVGDGEHGPWFVNTYRITQGYGGPEEGGWWYNCGEPVGSVIVETHKAARGVKEKLDKQEAEDKDLHRPASSAAGDGYDIGISIEDHPPKPWPDRRPHYE